MRGGAELSDSYDGRNRVVVSREAFAFVGTLAALVINYALSIGLEPAPAAARTLEFFAIFLAFALPLAALVTVLGVPSPRTFDPEGGHARGSRLHAQQHSVPAARAGLFDQRLRQWPAATLFIMFISDRLQLGEKAGLFLVIYFISGLIGMPFWLQVAKLQSKHRSWCYAMLLACAAFAFAPLLPAGAEAGFLVICVITGFSVGADLVLPASMQADVIDVDTAASGEQTLRAYLAVWGLATKLALALAVGIAFPLLAAAATTPATTCGPTPDCWRWRCSTQRCPWF